jgi:hypothetical protein
MKWIILFIFISCGKDIDPRETQLIFNFKKTNELTTNPQLEIRSDVVRTFNIINIILNNQAAPPIFSTTIQSVQ